jgi:hypothetical protein
MLAVCHERRRRSASDKLPQVFGQEDHTQLHEPFFEGLLVDDIDLLVLDAHLELDLE